MKRVRMLLRVSSGQQLEADGDLSIQRQILQDFISKHEDWELDPKEYFEGSKSAYKNTTKQRDVMQEILQDAKNGEFDILVPYKDDRVGRLLWDTPLYIMDLKKYGVDIYTVKEQLLSPELNDITGQLMLAIRYANAQKSSMDTGERVKDNAMKLVQNGKFMGGSAPFGYVLEYSGQISKHGRALKHLVIVPEQAELVKHIYSMSLNKEYGSAKIAKELNLDEKYKALAPNGVWKGGTITSILTNPIYAGHTAYKRRERINGQYHRLDSKDWITSFEANEEITIIDSDTWNKVQDKRKQRNDKYIKKLENKDVTVIRRNDGMLPLVDVLHCGYCGSKMVNGSKYNYWTIKGTGERRASKIPIYKCQNAWQGVPHDKTKMYRADMLEPIVFEALSQYVGKLQENENVFDQIEQNQNTEKKELEKLVKKEKQELAKIQKKIDVMESNVPNAMLGEYPLSLEELVSIIKKHKGQLEAQQEVVKQKELEFKNSSVSADDWKTLREQIPTWQDVFLNADVATKRVLVNKLIERIDVKKGEVVIRFKINLNDFFQQPRMSGEFGVQKPRV